MRHVHRHYFDNYPSEFAVDQFVALLDMGKDGSGNELYNTAGGPLTSAAEILMAAEYLLFAHCFFKLPVGASAIVDIYVPSDPGETVKSFDYQVFKSRKTPMVGEQLDAFKRSSETLANLIAGAKESEFTSQGPAGPSEQATATGPTGPTGPTGSCSLVSTGPSGPTAPCGGQTSRTCGDPIHT
ncbi:MAG: hypothetical protein ABI557_21320, partial [Aureliella sp.]